MDASRGLPSSTHTHRIWSADEKMKLLILAFDGLEVELVERWRLKALKQMVYGTYEAPRSPHFKKPYTPSVWATIITGKSQEEHGIDDWWTYGRLLDRLRYLPPFVWIKNKRRILWKLGLKPRIVDKRDHRVETLFDVIKPSKALFIPTINEPAWIHEEYVEALKHGLENYISRIWEVHRYRKRVFLQELEKDSEWKLFMVWFDIADLLGHVCISRCRHQFLKAYLDLDMLVKEVKKRLSNDTIMLIVSDHGMKPMPDGTGDHTDRGFWSLSADIPWFRPRKATDFYTYIVKLLSSG